MAQRLLFILIFLLLVRPIVLTEDPTCGDEPLISNDDVPCTEIVQALEIENNHNCPCYAIMKPDLARLKVDANSYTTFTSVIRFIETAVAVPPTPPPRLV